MKVKKTWRIKIMQKLLKHGLTIPELAKEIGHSRQYVWAVLHNKKGSDNTKEKFEEGIENLLRKRNEG